MEGDGPQGAALTTAPANAHPWLSPGVTAPSSPGAHPQLHAPRGNNPSPPHARHRNHQTQTQYMAAGEVGARRTPSLTLDPHQLPAEAVPDGKVKTCPSPA